ncbi:MAG: hypothetical protein ACLP52_29900 [Streptosporangiaceae bacterium]
MKLKIWHDEASTLDTNGWHETSDWREMNDWFAELRDDDGADPAGHGCAELAGDGSPSPRDAGAPAARGPAADAMGSGGARLTQRAVIGDQLRLPIAWCEMGSCISYHADPAALGEADIRGRAISAGWRIDALGRLACPGCQQASPGFRAACPVALRDRDAAITSTASMAAAVRADGTAVGRAARTAGALVPAIARQPARPAATAETPQPCLLAETPAQRQRRTSIPRHRRREALPGQQGAARSHRAATA